MDAVNIRFNSISDIKQINQTSRAKIGDYGGNLRGLRPAVNSMLWKRRDEENIKSVATQSDLLPPKQMELASNAP